MKIGARPSASLMDSVRFSEPVSLASTLTVNSVVSPGGKDPDDGSSTVVFILFDKKAFCGVRAKVYDSGNDFERFVMVNGSEELDGWLVSWPSAEGCTTKSKNNLSVESDMV